MTLLEFAEKTSPIPLMGYHKQLLTAYEQSKKENKQLVYIPPRISGKRMLIQIIEEFEEEQRMELTEQIKQNAEKIAEILTTGNDCELRKDKNGLKIIEVRKTVIEK